MRPVPRRRRRDARRCLGCGLGIKRVPQPDFAYVGRSPIVNTATALARHGSSFRLHQVPRPVAPWLLRSFPSTVDGRDSSAFNGMWWWRRWWRSQWSEAYLGKAERGNLDDVHRYHRRLLAEGVLLLASHGLARVALFLFYVLQANKVSCQCLRRGSCSIYIGKWRCCLLKGA